MQTNNSESTKQEAGSSAVLVGTDGTGQQTVFAAEQPIVLPTTAVPAVERRRLGGQCAQIIDLLRNGRATNRQLAEIALKYSSRISEIRKAGYDIRCVQRDHITGASEYALYENGVESS